MLIALDENVPSHVKTRLEADGHDAEFSRDIAGQGTPDKELLRICAQEGRTLLTNDRDFDRLHKSHNHEGILRYSINHETKEGWRAIVTGIDLIDGHLDMRNELQWPKQWADRSED